MKTIKDSGQQLLAVKRNSEPPDTLDLITVQYRTYQYQADEMTDDLAFTKHDPAQPEAKLVVESVCMPISGVAEAQVRNIEKCANEYASEVAAEHNLSVEQRELVLAGYLSGVMAASGALAIGDGVHPSKLVAACRIAGKRLLGVDSRPA
jgi:hypothetical protein